MYFKTKFQWSLKKKRSSDTTGKIGGEPSSSSQPLHRPTSIMNISVNTDWQTARVKQASKIFYLLNDLHTNTLQPSQSTAYFSQISSHIPGPCCSPHFVLLLSELTRFVPVLWPRNCHQLLSRSQDFIGSIRCCLENRVFRQCWPGGRS